MYRVVDHSSFDYASVLDSVEWIRSWNIREAYNRTEYGDTAAPRSEKPSSRADRSLRSPVPSCDDNMVFEYVGSTRLAAVVGFMDGPNRFPEERVGRAQVRAGGLITGGLIKSLVPMSSMRHPLRLGNRYSAASSLGTAEEVECVGMLA